MSVLDPGRTCWRVEHADRAACLVDAEDYYAALLAALRKAERSVLILGWAFDPRTRLAPDGAEGPEDPDEIGRVLLEQCRAKPALKVRVLVWKAPPGINGRHALIGHRAKRWFSNTPVIFREARDMPFGAAHHQKIIVVDDQIAFCGGGDLVTNRWDSQTHRDSEPRRILPDSRRHPARHDVMMLVDGPAAAALGALFRERWAGALGESCGEPDPAGPSPWPEAVTPQFANVAVGIARTQPQWRGRPLVDEVRQLTLACIAGARQTIYLENQYFTSRAVADALAARLAEPDGPEVVLVLNRHAPSWFDQATMDFARNPLIRGLRAADAFGRFRAFSPQTAGGARIIVHSKVGVFDDQVLRVGSANLNNRSAGFDTECDLIIEGADDATRRVIAEVSDLLLGHYLGVGAARFAQARLSAGGAIAAIEALNGEGRLAPVATGRPTCWEDFVSSRTVGDPSSAGESWRLRPRRT